MRRSWKPRRNSRIYRRQGKRDGAVGAEILCSYDADYVENIRGGASRNRDIGENFRLLLLLLLEWRWNSFRLRLMGFADNRGCSVRLNVQEREVVRGVVGELEKFASLKRRETAKEQSHHDEEDDFETHFRVLRYRKVIQQLDV